MGWARCPPLRARFSHASWQGMRQSSPYACRALLQRVWREDRVLCVTWMKAGMALVRPRLLVLRLAMAPCSRGCANVECAYKQSCPLPTLLFSHANGWLWAGRNSGLSSIVAELDKQPEPSFWCEIATPHFIGFGLWFGLQLLVQSFYASAIKNILLRKGDTTGVYADVFDIVSNLGFMFNPLIGVWLAKKGYTLVLALTILAGQGYLAVTFAASLPVQVVGFALLAVQRSLMFTSFYSYIAVGFDARMYGRLLGVLCVYGTVIGASQTALSHMALQTDHGDYSRVMYLQIGLMCTLYAWAVLVGWRESKAADTDGSDTVQRRREHSFNIAERAPTLRGHKQPEPLLNGPLSGASSYYSYAS